MADSGVDTEKIARLAKMAEAARLGGKGSIRRKHAPVHKTSSAQDDKRLQTVLKRLSMNVVPGEPVVVAPLQCPPPASSCLTSLQASMRSTCSWITTP
jgi:hypothetical protein